MSRAEPGDPWWTSGPDYDPDERECEVCKGTGKQIEKELGSDDDEIDDYEEVDCYRCEGTGLERNAGHSEPEVCDHDDDR
jgi:RecJ-like exonuclease